MIQKPTQEQKEICINITDYQCHKCKFFKPKTKSNCQVYKALIEWIKNGNNIDDFQISLWNLYINFGHCNQFKERN